MSHASGPRAARGDGAERLDDLFVETIGDGEEEVFLAVEVLVDRAAGEAGRLGDLLEGGAFEAAPGEHLGGGRDRARRGSAGVAVPG